MKLLTLTVALFVTPMVAFAVDNPFGFETQKHPSEYEYCKPSSSAAWYRCTAAPKPHSEFKGYLIQWVDNIGLCLIQAVGKDIANDSFGIQTRKRVDAIARQVAKKYGKESRKSDFLLDESIWSAANDWMMGLHEKERYYSYDWNPKKGFKRIGDITRIYVAAEASSNYTVYPDTGYIIAEFYTKHRAKCKEEIENQKADSF